MRQKPRVEPPTHSSPAIALHPVLSNALAHLDIQLEDELTRYRRQRLGTGRTVRPSSRNRSAEALELIAVSAAASGVNTAVQPEPLLEEPLAEAGHDTPNTYKPIPAFTATPQPFESAIALRTSSQPLTHDGSADNGSSSHGDEAYALAHPANPKLDDYLESSEELLRSLANEQAEVQAERHFMRSLLTPLGLGSLLLLLLSSAMFGYVIMNPSSLPWLAKQTPGAAPTEPNSNGGNGVFPSSSGGAAGNAPPQPDLTKRELPELNLNNLGTVNVKPGKNASTALTTQTPPTPDSKPKVAATQVSPSNSQPDSAPAASTQPPIPAVTSSSSRPYVRPEASRSAAPASAPVRRAPEATAPPAATANRQSTGEASNSYQYKLGIPFANDQTLENARKVVPDAFVRTLPDGRTIVQVGAARDEAEGKATVQKLRDQGLSSSEVYKR